MYVLCFLNIVSSDEGSMPADGAHKNHNHLINNIAIQRSSGNKDNNTEEPAEPLEPQPALRTILQVSVY